MLTGVSVRGIAGNGQVRAVTTDLESLPADLVVYGIGAAPRDELARGADLATDNGIVVDEQLRSDRSSGSDAPCASSVPNPLTSATTPAHEAGTAHIIPACAVVGGFEPRCVRSCWAPPDV
ncbi:FAD-dependent oxidoreductase [Nocardia sp. NBC_01730]|uniref:FAD-dependent oxidoreductase n=1 Tax=Nocardia sp. NBC_01730 TaxID=2975998 RepID=UPI003FA3C543